MNIITRIKPYSFQKLKNLKKLNLERNQIDSNGFQGLDNLEELYLGNNNFAKIESNSFQYLNKLKELDLSSNQIEQIDPNEFRVYVQMIPTSTYKMIPT